MRHHVGTIKELWRYPVKSMVGEIVDQAQIEKLGMQGDRGWAIRDEQIGELTTVRKMPTLLQCVARYNDEPAGDQVPHVSIRMPDGTAFSSADEDANKMLSEYLQRSVTLWPLQSRSHWRHYLLAKPSGAKAMKKQFASKALPDLSSISWLKMMELAIFATPLGRYYDCYPLHILTSNSLKKLTELEPQGSFCQQRFRPNLFIESTDSAVCFDEFLWLGGRLMIGETIIRCESRTVRCSMPAQPQTTLGLGKDSKVLRTLEKNTGRHLGINATIVRGGQIKVGDKVEWQPANHSIIRKELGSASNKLKNALIHTSLNLIDRISLRK